jgi:hypothetical protein
MEEPQVEQPQEIEDEEEYQEPPRPRTWWIAPAWFLFGVIVGVAGLAVFTRLMTTNRPSADSVAFREAAREGMLDAVATLNATQGQVPERGTPAPVKTSFDLRDANRLGSKTAKVTIIEFSDFQ